MLYYVRLIIRPVTYFSTPRNILLKEFEFETIKFQSGMKKVTRTSPDRIYPNNKILLIQI
jgi:hypothetical protein